MLEKRVVVGVVQHPEHGFLVTWNDRWNGYAFPMKRIPEDGGPTPELAIQAVAEDLGYDLPNAKATEIEYLGRYGVSDGTDQDTLYSYWVYTVEPNRVLDHPEGQANPPKYLTQEEITTDGGTTWSTSTIAKEFIESQEAVLAVVHRKGESEPEYLLLKNNNYGGFFFPSQRVTSALKPEDVASCTVRAELDFDGEVTSARKGEVPDVHTSSRFQGDRNYLFHVCQVDLTGIDLNQEGNAIEQALSRRGVEFKWVPASQLTARATGGTETMKAVATTVINLVP